jgi:hypothetical protein
MLLQSILATPERAAGALIDRQHSAGYLEIRRMSGYGTAAQTGHSSLRSERRAGTDRRVE